MPNINNFKGHYHNLARPNRFFVTGFGLPTDARYYAKAASLPATTIGIIDANYQGRLIKIDGDRTYEDFSMTFYGEQSMEYREIFEEWNNQFNGPESNTGHLTYRDGTVNLLDRHGSVTTTFFINDAICSQVAAIELDWGTNDTALEFTVTLAYNYHTVKTDNPRDKRIEELSLNDVGGGEFDISDGLDPVAPLAP